MAYKPHVAYSDSSSEEQEPGEYSTILMTFLRKYRKLHTPNEMALKLGIGNPENEKDAAALEQVAACAEYLHDIGAIYMIVDGGVKKYGYDATTAYHLGEHYEHKS